MTTVPVLSVEHNTPVALGLPEPLSMGMAAIQNVMTEGEAALGTMKLCRNCGKKKSRTDFHKNHAKADELEDVCKACKAQRDAARRKSRANVCSILER
jgi:hypothetical protein